MPDFWSKSLQIDPKRAISARFAVFEQREILGAIIILNHELEAIRTRSREPMLCHIRYQFWRDFLQNPDSQPNTGLVGEALWFLIDLAELQTPIEALIDAHGDYALSLSSSDYDRASQMDMIFERLISLSIQAVIEIEPENIEPISNSASSIFGKSIRATIGQGAMPTGQDFAKLNDALYDFDSETNKIIIPTIAYIALCKKQDLFIATNVDYENLRPWAKLRAEFAIATSFVRQSF